MNKTEIKILKAIQTNRLSIQTFGERSWYNYLLRVTELVWCRNLYDGYLIEVYSKDEKHLCTVKI